jgi:predicted O-linked N-acetylglucosamine transferase (SPINDLY family)
MGVPVITFPGKTFAGRHSFSYLSNIGYEQFVASNWNSYINMAVQWAQRAEELAAIRAELRGRMRSSPLCQYEPFAEQLLHLLTEAKRKTF